MSITVTYNEKNHDYLVESAAESLRIPLSFINSNRSKVSAKHPQAIQAFAEVLAHHFQQKDMKLGLSQHKDGIYFDLSLLGQKIYKDVGQHFNSMAERYNAGCEKVNWITHDILFERLKPYVDTSLDTHLDLGTGTGKVAQKFKNEYNNIKVTGIDLAGDMLAIAKQNGHIDSSIIGNALDLSLTGDKKYKLVTCGGVLDFVDEMDAFANRVKGSLDPEGGVVAISHETYSLDSSKGKGHRTFQHLSEMIQGHFKTAGIRILEAGHRHDAYTSFVTGKPVENEIIIGALG